MEQTQQLYTIGAFAKRRGVTNEAVDSMLKHRGIDSVCVEPLSGTRYYSLEQVEQVAAPPRHKYTRPYHNVPVTVSARR